MDCREKLNFQTFGVGEVQSRGLSVVVLRCVRRVWEQWVRDGYANDAKNRLKMLYRTERKRRDAFKELLQDCVNKGALSWCSCWICSVRTAQRRRSTDPTRVFCRGVVGELSHKSEWPSFVASIKDEPRYRQMIGQGGSTPRELFEEAVKALQVGAEDLKEKFSRFTTNAGIDIADRSLTFEK